MEQDQLRTENEHVSKPPPPALHSSSGPQLPADSSSIAESHEQARSADHDSLVTVRLSEPPPSLHVNTNVGSSVVVPSKKTPYGHEYTPSDAMAETVREEEEEEESGGEDGRVDGGKAPGPRIDIERQPPSPSWSGEGRSLGDELCEAGEDENGVGQPDEEDGREDDPATHRRNSSASEVDWNELQKTEDAQSKKDSGNVSSIPRPTWGW